MMEGVGEVLVRVWGRGFSAGVREVRFLVKVRGGYLYILTSQLGRRTVG